MIINLFIIEVRLALILCCSVAAVLFLAAIATVVYVIQLFLYYFSLECLKYGSPSLPLRACEMQRWFFFSFFELHLSFSNFKNAIHPISEPSSQMQTRKRVLKSGELVENREIRNVNNFSFPRFRAISTSKFLLNSSWNAMKIRLMQKCVSQR